MQPTPQQIGAEALQGLTADVATDMSVYGRSAASALSAALSGVLGVELGVVDPLARVAVGAAMDAAVVILQNTFGSAAAELVEYAGETAADVVKAVPLIGQIIGLFISVGTGMQRAAAAHASAAAAHKQQDCFARYVPVVGSAALNARVPADYFASKDRGLNSHLSTRGLPSVGLAFVRVVTGVGPQGEDQGEGMLDSLMPDPIRVSRVWSPGSADAAWIAARKTHAVLRARARSVLKDKQIGIPIDRIYTMWRLALAIQAQHHSFDPPGVVDGGAALWPVLIDLLRAEFESGRMTEAYARYLWERAGYCARLDDRGLRELLELVRGWSSFVSPFYVQDKPQARVLVQRPAEVVAAAGSIARRMSGASRPLRLAPERIARIAHTWGLPATPEVRRSPPATGGAALAVVAALSALLLVRRRR